MTKLMTMPKEATLERSSMDSFEEASFVMSGEQTLGP